MKTTHDPRFLEFIRLFNREAFYEAHEVLEDLWLQCTGDQKSFYQGLIQCAVAFAHWQRKNPKGAKQVMDRALATLKKFDTKQEEVHVRKLIEECEGFFASSGPTFPRIRTDTDPTPP